MGSSANCQALPFFVEIRKYIYNLRDLLVLYLNLYEDI